MLLETPALGLTYTLLGYMLLLLLNGKDCTKITLSCILSLTYHGNVLQNKNEIEIGFMHDDVICLKFTPSLVYTKVFSNLCHLLVIFTRSFFVSWSLQVRTLKARLEGEIGYSDVNMHKGYYLNSFQWLLTD